MQAMASRCWHRSHRAVVAVSLTMQWPAAVAAVSHLGVVFRTRGGRTPRKVLGCLSSTMLFAATSLAWMSAQRPDQKLTLPLSPTRASEAAAPLAASLSAKWLPRNSWTEPPLATISAAVM